MTARTLAALAASAADDVRAVNHALHRGFAEPADAYATVGALAQLVAGLPQAMEMIGRAVRRIELDGNLRSDRGTLSDDLADTYSTLDQAAAGAHGLHQALETAHAALGHLGLQYDEEDDQ